MRRRDKTRNEAQARKWDLGSDKQILFAGTSELENSCRNHFWAGAGGRARDLTSRRLAAPKESRKFSPCQANYLVRLPSHLQIGLRAPASIANSL